METNWLVAILTGAVVFLSIMLLVVIFLYHRMISELTLKAMSGNSEKYMRVTHKAPRPTTALAEKPDEEKKAGILEDLPENPTEDQLKGMFGE